MFSQLAHSVPSSYSRHPFLSLCLILGFAMLLLSACETDLKEVDRIANIKKEEAVDISYGVTITYSDSAVVKAVLTSTEMRIRHDSAQNYEFPKGIQIVFYDPSGKESQRITSEYAIQREQEKTTTFKKNVVVTTIDGKIVKTEELIHDENTNTFYNQVLVTGYFPGGNNLQGSSFSADGNFEEININNGTALYHIEANSAFPSFQ